MLGRWFILTVIGIGLFTYVHQSDDSRAATATVTQACSAAKPGTATVTWVWPGPSAGAQQTWFDISLVPGFAPGWFQGHGPMPAAQTAYAMDGVPQGLTFFYRVNTLYGSGWRETASGSFVASCGGGGAGGGPPVAGNVDQACAGGGVTVTFHWQAKAPGPQFLDLTVHNNGFAPGTFVGAGPVASGGSSFTWYGIAKGVTHYWRVNTLTPTGWVGSNTSAFTASSCLPPEKACVGYMAGYSGAGKAECDQLMSAPTAMGNCVRYILKLPINDGKSACVNAAVSAGGYLSDCLLGLSGQSHFGLTSCRIYYNG